MTKALTADGFEFYPGLPLWHLKENDDGSFYISALDTNYDEDKMKVVDGEVFCRWNVYYPDDWYYFCSLDKAYADYNNVKRQLVRKINEMISMLQKQKELLLQEISDD